MKKFEYLGKAIMFKGRLIDISVSEQDFIREVLKGAIQMEENECPRKLLMRGLHAVKHHGFVKIPNDVVLNSLLNTIESLTLDEVKCVMKACGGEDYV